MKFTAIILLTACLQVSANLNAQNKISLSVKNAPIEKVFRDIERQSGFIVWYERKLLEKTKKVTLQITEVSLDQALSAVLKDQPLDFSIVGKTIVISDKPKRDQPIDTTIEKLITARGFVYNEAGQPLAGANVVSKISGRGTITNAQGEYQFSLLSVNSVLVISFVGYSAQQIVVSDSTTKKVYLNVTKNELDKVVVQAYGTTTQRLNTGNIATVTSEEIEKQPVMNPLLALQGRVAGLEITQSAGYASSPIKVEIRGRNVLDSRTTSDPLYIIDGVPLTILELGGNSSNSLGSTGFMQGQFVGPDGGQNPFFSINPNDIETVTVLKDADATAIYGSRGANGVIIINTKKGHIGNAKLEIDAYHGISKVTRYYKMLNTEQYVTMRREAYKNDNIIPDQGNAYDLLIWDTTRYTDWQKYVWGSFGRNSDAQLSFSGGDKQNIFRLAANYHFQTDITTRHGAAERGGIQFNLSHNSTDQKLNISFTTIYSSTKTDMVNIQGLVTLPPNAPPAFNNAGKFNYRGWDPISTAFPFAGLQSPYSASTNYLNSNLNIKYELIRGLQLITNFGYSYAAATQMQSNPKAAQDPLVNSFGSASFGYNNTKNWIVEPRLSYRAAIKKGVLNIIVGASTQSVITTGNTITGTGYTNDALLGSISNAPTKSASDYFGKYKYAALFSQVNYNWAEKYIVNFSARRDGSSRFGPGNQFGNFGAVGAAWIFTEENWLQKTSHFLSFGKIRASYGITGSDQIGDYKYLSRWSGSIVPYQGTSSYSPTQLANPDYQWAVNRKLEAALDLSFFKDRHNIEIAWYRNRCDNQLIGYPLPLQSGFATITANSIANVQNSGIELIFVNKIIDNSVWKWQVRFNIASNKNKLLAYPNLDLSPYATTYAIGKPLNLVHLLRFNGVDTQTGIYTYEDKNKDGAIKTYGADNDLFPFDLNPKYSGGILNELRYKNLTLSLYFYFRKQTGRNAYAQTNPAGGIYNVPIQVLNRWMKPGDEAPFARYTTTPLDPDAFFTTSTAIFSDASLIRLQNAYLQFSLPTSILKKSPFKLFQAYLKGENLLTITNYKGLDPDVQFFGGMPLSKTFTLGIKCQF